MADWARSRGSDLVTSRQLVAAAGQDLVRVGLVPDVPQDLVAGRIEHAVKGDRELARTESVTRYAAREQRPGAEVDAETYVRAHARGFFHPTGTCSLGKVVDERARVFGYENLVVADASIMPTIPRANTNLTTAAISEKIAEELR